MNPPNEQAHCPIPASKMTQTWQPHRIFRFRVKAPSRGCACTGKNLVRLVRPAILTVLAEENLHGYRILERLAGMTMFHGQPPDPAGIYRVLKSMEQEGLVHCAWDLQGSGPAQVVRPCGQRALLPLSSGWAPLKIILPPLASLWTTYGGAGNRAGNSAGAARDNCASAVPPVGQLGSASGKPCCCASAPQSVPIDSSGSFGDS